MSEDQVRLLLEEAVADVEPGDGLDRVRARTRRRRRRGHWVLAVGGAVAATAATVATIAAVGALAPKHPQAAPAGQGAPRIHRSPSSANGPLVMNAPAPGSSVSSPFVVRGRAATFEGTVQWELRQGGAVVERGFTTARECCTLSPFSFTVRADPGTYTLVVHDEDVSRTEGQPPARVSEKLTVR